MYVRPGKASTHVSAGISAERSRIDRNPFSRLWHKGNLSSNI